MIILRNFSYLGLFFCSLFFREAAAGDCPTPKEEQLSYVLLKEIIQNPACQIRTITDLLEKLPESYRSGYSLMYKSNSIQDPNTVDYLNPRAIVFGSSETSSNLVISFNGDPKQRGNNAIEIMEIVDKKDAGPKIFKFSEIQFPYEEKEIGNRTWNETQKKITFSETNPGKCISCHGEPAHPIFSGYPNWEGAYGSQHIGSIPPEEEEGFNQYLKKVKSDEPSRYKSLKKIAISSGYGAYSDLGETSLSTMTEANLIFNQKLGAANAVRVARLIYATPDYEKYKYAFLGAFNRCDDLPGFIPEPAKSGLFKNIESQFHLNKKWTKKEIDEMDKEIENNPRLFLILPDYYNYKKAVGNDTKFLKLELDTFKIQETTRADPMTAMLRLLLEGRGLSMDGYFMDLLNQTYRSHNGGNSGEDTHDEFVRLDQGLARDLESYKRTNESKDHDKLCENLKEKSLKSLKGSKVDPILAPVKDEQQTLFIEHTDCNKPGTEIAKGNFVDVQKVVDGTSKIYLEKQQQMFGRYCMECHGGTNPFLVLPLESIGEMANYKPIISDLAPLERLQQNIMPPSYAKLQPTAEERREMINILKELKNK